MIFDTRSLDAAFKKIAINASELQQIEAPGGETLARGMKQRAAVDSGYMKNNVFRHVVKADSESVEDEVGSDAPYAVYQEYGTGIYAENGAGRSTPWVYRRKDGAFVTTSGNRPHPFVRPTAINYKDKTINAIEAEFKRFILTKWN